MNFKHLISITLAAGFSACAFSAPAPDDSDLAHPFAYSNLNPFIQVHGIPASRSANLLGNGKFHLALQTEFANHFSESASAPEQISLDGETHRATLSLQYGVTDRLEIGLAIPYLRHTGGSLDSFIETWHDTFGLPEGRRDDVPEDRLALLHARGLSVSGINSSATGIGDITLSAGYRLSETEHSSWTVRGHLKLATGDAGDLTGSEAGGFYLSAHHSNSDFIPHENWSVHTSLGVGLLDKGEVLEDLQEDWIIYGSTTVAWQAMRRVNLKAQLDFHSAVYDSPLKELGDPAVLLLLGGSLQLTDNLVLDLSVSEDIVTDTSPDVVLQVGFRTRF